MTLKEKLGSALELVFASDKIGECYEQLREKSIVLYNSEANRVIEKATEISPIKMQNWALAFNGINYCKVVFKTHKLDNYYDYAGKSIGGQLVIESGEDIEAYSIGETVKYAEDKAMPISGCKYVIANLQPTTRNFLDVTKFKVYELNDLQIDTVIMNGTVSQAVKIPQTKPEYLICLYDFPEKPHNDLFIFQPKYHRALDCFNTLEKAGYHIWDSAQNKQARQQDVYLTNINCDWKCMKSRGESYAEWCKNVLKTEGFHHFYEFNAANPSPLKIKGGMETDTYSIGVTEQRIDGITKVDGCKYIMAGFDQSMQHVIDLTALKVKFGDLFFHNIYMNDTQSLAVHISKVQPDYVFCVLDYNDELVAENFIFAHYASSKSEL